MGNVLESSNQEVVEGLIAEGGRVILYFTAPWCGPCRGFKPHFERAAAELDQFTFIRTDVDKADWAHVEYGVRTIPTVKLYEDGEFVRDIKAPQGALPFMRDIKE